ncbi:MAG TPA: outer membrane beta-barrel protein [Xanthobacteraceae bacterium]|nr:outer membrane beta-barrel protein [Xanthobacteraceae bacterium]
MNRLLLSASALALMVGANTALAADMPRPVTKAPATVVAPMFNWSGFYVGLDAGYLWSRVDLSVPASPASGTAHGEPDSFTAGGHIGWRQQFNGPWVVGVEADWSWLDGSDRADLSGAPGEALIAGTNWDASLRGVLGFASNRTLYYVTGGWSWIDGNGCGSSVPGVCFPNTDVSDTLDGWTAGAGIAHAYADNLILRLEYLYADYGRNRYAGAGFTGGLADVDAVTHKVRVGVSWRFASGKAPVAAPAVVTKY